MTLPGVPEPLDQTLFGMLSGSMSFGERLSRIHKSVLGTWPAIDRVACALYERANDELKTFAHSTRSGEAISNYHYKLSKSLSLSESATTGRARVLKDIRQDLKGDSEHTAWVRKEGYESSLTMPLYDHGELLGFVFFDSRAKDAFGPACQRDLMLYCGIINILLAEEIRSARSILASADIARSFANLRDFETGAHLDRMAQYSRLIARGVADSFGLSDEFIEGVFRFAPLHDIGKVGIPDRILLKPGRLEPEERAIMCSHVVKGVEVAQRILRDLDLEAHSDSRLLINIIGGHHEFMDGSGYPAGLSGDAVPVEARIVTVADIFDALTTERPYKKAWSVEDANAEMNRLVQQGKLDPLCVKALERSVEQVGLIRETYVDS